MNGPVSAVTNANSSAAGATAAINGKGDQAQSDRFANPVAATPTVYRLDVSSLAVKSKVFESLLTQHGLGNDQNTPSDLQRRVAAESQHDRRDDGKAPEPQMPESSQQKLAGTTRKRNSQPVVVTGSQPMIYEFDARPEQLAALIKQIGEKSDSFSAPKPESASSLSQTFRYGDNLYGGGGMGDGGMGAAGMGVGGMGGGQPVPSRRGGQQAAKANAKEAMDATAQPQAAPPIPAPLAAQQAALSAAGAPVQHVVFVLNVVDRLPPVAGRASQSPPPAAAPAKQ